MKINNINISFYKIFLFTLNIKLDKKLRSIIYL